MMQQNTRSRKIISIIVSAIMVLTMFPLMAFTSVAATNPVYSGGGEWLHDGSDFKSGYASLNSKSGTFYTSMAIPVTNYYFMQTTDNQIMTYTVDFYACKNDTVNAMVITSLNTNATNDTAFAAALSAASAAGEMPENWANPNGYTNDFGGGANFFANSNGVEAKKGGIPHFTYTVTFVANGSAVYHPQWEIGFKSRGGYEWLGYTFESYITSHMQHDSYYINENPEFNIQVIDLREVNNLIDIANSLGINPNTYTGGRDFSGATFYSQETVDEVVTALRAALLCDYSALDAQLARAADIEPNYVGKRGDTLYDSDLYDAFTDAYADAQAVDRFLMEDGTGANEAIINDAADALETALDNLVATRNALITYYNDGVMFDRNVAPLGRNYNFHDVTDKYIGTPTMAHYVFDKWTDINGNRINENTLITGDIDAYSSFVFDMEGIAPLETGGRWEHELSPNDSDGRGDNYVTMWVQDTDFKFVQTTDNETFSFYTDLFAYKNDGGNVGRIKNVDFLENDSQTNDFIAVLGGRDAETYCVSANSGPRPSANDIDNDGVEDGNLPGQFGNGYTTMKNNYCVDWRFVYTFDANGSATYVPKWDITYYSANDDVLGIGAGTHTLADEDDKTGLDKYVNFTITVSDMRPLINMVNKAESIYNNPNSYAQFDQNDLDDLRDLLDDIDANYTLDGSVYYEQSVIDGLVNDIKAIIPDGTQVLCDYTELDAAIALADQKMAEYNNNADSHFINEVWTNFTLAYDAATSVDRNLYIIESNANQTFIDDLTYDLNEAIQALLYQTHVNEPCDYDSLTDAVDDAVNTIGTDNSDGLYDDDVWQDYIDALNDAQDLIDNNLYDDEGGANQQAIDDALQALEDAINALSQNSPCDYSALDAAIAAAQAVGNNSNAQYTAATYEALQDAIAAGQAVPRDLYDNGTNQQTIDDAAQAINDALAALTENALVDTSALEDAVDDAENNAPGLDNSDSQYKEDAWQDYLDALDDAHDIIDNPPYDDEAGNGQQQVDDALQALEDAIAALNDPSNQNGLCNYAALDAAIEAAEDLGDNSNHKYTEATFQALQDALAAAQAVERDMYDDEAGVNQGIIDDATTALADALNALVTNSLVDTTDLEDAVDDVTNNWPGLDNSDGKYDDDAWQDYLDAVDNAQDLIDNPPYDDEGGEGQQQVDDAYQAIIDALDALDDPANQNDPCDYSALEAAIAAAQSINNSDLYTAATYQALEDAVAAGQAVPDGLYDNGTNQQTIDDAADAIMQAIQDLLEETIITAYNDVDTYGMTQDSIDELNAAIDAAEDARDNTTATAQEKADAINALVDAVSDLAVDKTELEELITIAENIDTSILPSFEADELADAITAAQDVDSDANATVDDVIQAIEDLKDAIAQALINATTAAENIDTDGMTDSSAQALADAIQSANDLLDEMGNPNNTVTAQEMADAINDLSSSANDLTPDKTALEDAIAAGEGVDTTDIPQNLVDALEDALTDGQTVDADSDATVQEVADATDAINDALDDILEYVVDEAENTDTTGMTDQSIQDLQDAIDNANDVLNNPDATAQEKADAIADVQNAIDDLTPDKTELEEKIEEAENADTTGVKPEVIDALEDAVENAQNVDNDPDATVDEIQDAIQQLEDAIAALDDPGNWIEFNRFVPTSAGGAYVDRVDSDNLYFMGIDASATTLADVKALLENDGRQIVVFRGDTQLTDSDLVGTGCVIKCISIKNPSVVYEQATVILYGDVNGDGLINQDDYDAEFNETLFDEKIVGDIFRKAGDLNNDGVIDGFDMSKLELQLTGARPIDQIGRTLRIDVDEVNVSSVTTADGSRAVDTAAKFTAVEKEIEIAAKDYKDWDVDFAVSFNKDVNGSDVFIYGQYDAYGEEWIGGNLSNGQIAAGAKTYLMRDLIASFTGNAVTVNYADIVTAISEMNTAIHVENPEDGLTVKVELILTEPDSGRTHIAAEYTYTY